jgi:hypothetical protein
MLKLKGRTVSNDEQVLETLGTVRELVGKGGRIYPSNINNVMNVNKRLLITLEDKDKETEVLLTSPALNQRLRSKEIQLRDVLDYPVYLTIVRDEEGVESERAVIGVHQGHAVTSLAVSSDDKATKKAKEINIKDIEAYISL